MMRKSICKNAHKSISKLNITKRSLSTQYYPMYYPINYNVNEDTKEIMTNNEKRLYLLLWKQQQELNELKKANKIKIKINSNQAFKKINENDNKSMLESKPVSSWTSRDVDNELRRLYHIDNKEICPKKGKSVNIVNYKLDILYNKPKTDTNDECIIL